MFGLNVHSVVTIWYNDWLNWRRYVMPMYPCKLCGQFIIEYASHWKIYNQISSFHQHVRSAWKRFQATECINYVHMLLYLFKFTSRASQSQVNEQGHIKNQSKGICCWVNDACYCCICYACASLCCVSKSDYFLRKYLFFLRQWFVNKYLLILQRRIWTI